MNFVKKNKLLAASFILLLMFGLWNLTWWLVIHNRYKPFIEAVPKSQAGTYVVKKEDGYNYNVKLPDYLSYTGNLGVSNSEKGEALIIWPLISGGYKYGFRLQKDGKAYEIYVDENLNPIDKNDEKVTQIFQKFKPELNALYAKARGVWDLK